jgi:hypothetical protein
LGGEHILGPTGLAGLIGPTALIQKDLFLQAYLQMELSFFHSMPMILVAILVYEAVIVS